MQFHVPLKTGIFPRFRFTNPKITLDHEQLQGSHLLPGTEPTNGNFVIRKGLFTTFCTDLYPINVSRSSSYPGFGQDAGFPQYGGSSGWGQGLRQGTVPAIVPGTVENCKLYTNCAAGLDYCYSNTACEKETAACNTDDLTCYLAVEEKYKKLKPKPERQFGFPPPYWWYG
ncbi:hypothetical protein Fcan01_22824 [Folsomia candida]|uniref:Uncharacterized protein n=1 Tax=Folsomia candida TaxID=158441 RepID=A0A226DB65_FOLCA|nr:hypothetical protein Fcan01_22824 [Folsomia candida]